MDQLDKYIQDIVSQKITEPDDLEEIMLNAIHTAKGKKRIRRYKITRAIITSVTTIIITTGVGVAGFIAYDKIWKNPEKYTYEEIQETIAEGNNVGEVENLITEETAKQNATTIMNNLGYNNETIKSITLQKDINNNNKPFYVIRTGNNENEGIVITLNGNTGELNSFTNNEFNNINVKEDEISNDQAKEYSEQIIENIGFTEKEYQFTECSKQQITSNNQIKSVWVAKYYKLYDGIYNPYEVLTNNFVINDNKIEISSIVETSDGTYDNNPTVVTQDEAIQIAINKEKELTSREIESTSSEIGIRKMNSYIYQLENNLLFSNSKFMEDGSIDIEDKNIRKVWMVKIIHTNFTKDLNKLDTNEVLKSTDKIYYIDITTAEILGGEEIIEGGN